MKTICLVLTFVFPFGLAAQHTDTTAVYQQVDSLIRQSRELTGAEDFDAALSINAAAETLALERLGRMSAAFGNCCFNHGRVLHLQGDFPEAERWYLDGLAIFKSLPGPPASGYGRCLNNLAHLYRSMRDVQKLEALYRELLLIREKTQDSATPDFAICRHTMANALTDLCRYEQAEPLYREALAIYSNAYGREDARYARCQNSLAILCMELGDYEQSERLYRETIDIQAETLGPDHFEYALSLNNLANLYLMLGNYEQAEPLYRRARTILERSNNTDDPNYAICLDNLGVLYLQMGQFDQAGDLYQEALSLRESMVGKTHPDYALTLEHQAILYKRQGAYDVAEPLYRQALDIYKQTYGDAHPEYARSMNNMGELYLTMGRYREAEPLLRASFAIAEKILGKAHPEYLTDLSNLADLYAGVGDIQQAAGLLTQASALQRDLLSRAVRHLSERELGRYQDRYEKARSRLLSYAALYPDAATNLAGACYDDALFHKGFLLYASGQVRTKALANNAAETVFLELKACERRLAAEYALPLAEQEGVEALTEQINTLEKQLASAVAGLGDALRQIRYQDVQQKLQSGEAAIEFVQYRHFDRTLSDSSLYAALLLRPGPAVPQLVPLCNESVLDALIQTPGTHKADYVNSLYTVPERGVTPLGTPKESLYNLLWQPLESQLDDVRTIYFAPTGLLHRLNLGAIPLPDPPTLDEQALADRYRLVRLGSTRQLAIPAETKPAVQDAWLFGDVQYDLDSLAMQQWYTELPDKTVASRGGAPSFIRGAGPGSWAYLKWTGREVDALEVILSRAGLQPSVFKGSGAMEETFKSVGTAEPSPRILHLATHGFFFPDPAAPAGGRTGETDLFGNPVSATAPRKGDAERNEPAFMLSSHPMIRSGLVFSGANYAWKSGKPFRAGMEDGILTAYEISQIDLSNTELAVLSACETGLGDIRGNEGVYGLQRAFKIAGVRYLIMSLWQVPDFQTQELMTVFYANWLETGHSIPEAFRLAQQEMREKYQNPYFWAGFVLME